MTPAAARLFVAAIARHERRTRRKELIDMRTASLATADGFETLLRSLDTED